MQKPVKRCIIYYSLRVFLNILIIFSGAIDVSYKKKTAFSFTDYLCFLFFYNRKNKTEPRKTFSFSNHDCLYKFYNQLGK